MATAYVIHGDGRTEAMTRIRCENEDLELQLVLERNPDLLPGDQIDPDDPRRWLLVKREMPVPSPSTGTDWWSVDFLFADQDAIPTLVECKRFADMRSRREVVGQMLEYAANGHHYWTREVLRDYATAAAAARGRTLEESLRELRPTDDESIDAFFDRVEQNLRRGQLRIIFFLEESPFELRSVVDFLNKQMELSEVLLVEARQYSHAETRIVVPTLFGYTEQARQAKRSASADGALARKIWDLASFLADAQTRIGQETTEAMLRLHTFCVQLGCDISWGRGKVTGSFSVRESTACTRSLVTVYSDGVLSLNFSWLNGSASADWTNQRMRSLMLERAAISVPANAGDCRLRAAEWTSKAPAIEEALKQLVTEARERAIPLNVIVNRPLNP